MYAQLVNFFLAVSYIDMFIYVACISCWLPRRKGLLVVRSFARSSFCAGTFFRLVDEVSDTGETGTCSAEGVDCSGVGPMYYLEITGGVRKIPFISELGRLAGCWGGHGAMVVLQKLPAEAG